MSTTRLARALALATLVASGAYVFVYLARWEWNRAIVAALIFLAAEIGLIGAAILSRLDRARSEDANPRLAAIRSSRPPASKPFAWLEESVDRTNVFIPILLGAGMVFSAVAWVIEHVARVSVTPAMERDLADRLESLAWPEGGLLGISTADDHELLRGPIPAEDFGLAGPTRAGAR